MVFYRKYRPQIIEELDSEEIRNKLFSVLSASSVPHAFLFTGPKGLGKTSTARIVAKAVNCQRLAPSKLASSSKTEKLNARRYTLNAAIEPCNKCQQCISVTNGTNMDVLEIDAASNRGIDEIRDLREKIRLSPVGGNKKVYIIDEVHMLTTEAFNALLKTLEEPPSHALFILCTTESHKVPATILSRCFHISFKTASEDELMRSFKRIVKEEKIEIDEDSLKHIFSLSDGSFRDGVKILEELAFLSNGEKITKVLVEEKYQVTSIKYQVLNLLEFLQKKDTKSSLKLVSELTEQGVDTKYFIEQMINELHGELLESVGAAAAGPAAGEKQYLSIQEIKKLIELLAKAHGELKYAVLPQLPLELIIIEWGELNKNAPHEKDRHILDVKPISKEVSQGNTSEVARSDSSDGEGIGGANNKDIWKNLIDKVKLQNHSIAGVLRGCSIKSYDGKSLVIEAGYKFHKEKLEENKTQELLEKVGGEIIGKTISVSVILKEK
ncbi:DNA polymerase III subunit gamma/tau [Candidatus Microgenomates bacterium]|nr:MAG: DNA polymerase III subunit gamma/tau [Candidatus Microgenomates bacterium]